MNTDPRIITFKELRQAIGWLGILLPFVLAILLYAFTSCSIQDSISQYYYTRMGSYLTGTLCAVGLFMLAYKGYPGENDRLFCNFAGLCAFGVAFIPMQLNAGDVPCPDCIVFFTQGDHWWRMFHFVSAGLLFLTMAYMSYFRFTLSSAETVKGTKKYTRNTIYKLCGIIIFTCILLMLLYSILQHINPSVKVNGLTFFMESIMLVAFGTSWLVKGEGVSFLND